jgi:4-alpha-glucanotransferase
MLRRGSGILLHITSLPSSYGIGDMGPWSYRFADFLGESKQSLWQILPLNPTEPGYANSPYQSESAFAGNPLLISPELMVRDGLLEETDLGALPEFPKGRVDYDNVVAYKQRIFDVAYERFIQTNPGHEYEEFSAKHAFWLDDFALFKVLKIRFPGKVWTEWPQEIRDRQPEALQALIKELHKGIEREKFLQYLFFRQWISLKDYCNQRGIQIFGDIPIYVIHDSVDVWANPELFKLDDHMEPSVVAGVPPDYFSETGQLWGNPIYQWDRLRESGYSWWIRRMEHNSKLSDFVRVDHFRGLVGYWEVPAHEENAVKGRWVEAPAEDFFNTLLKRFPQLPIVAEDLGVITPDVREIMYRFDLPGMKVLLFAFGDDLPTNPYVPHNLPRNCIIYTGTHDNNTVKGWFEREATPEIKKRLFQYLGREVPVEKVHWELIRIAMMSVANMAIFPMQDILGLGEEARMNRPATTEGNWQWQLLPEQLTPHLTQRLLEMTEIYGRA